MGPAKTCVVGLAAVVGGYMAMSYTDNLFLLLVEYAVASLGSGTTFLCALSTAIGMGYPIGIALVSSLPCGLAVVTPGELAHLLRLVWVYGYFTPGVADDEPEHFLHCVGRQGVWQQL